MVELLVAIAILGIITILALPTIEGIRTKNNLSTYQKYEDSVVSSAKLYTDSYDVDMFAYNTNGCSKVSYENLKNKNLLKEIQIKDANCNDENTFVIVKKINGKFQYQQQMICKDSKGNILYENKIKNPICTEESAAEGPTLTTSGKKNEWIKEGDYSVKVKVADPDGLIANNKLIYKWSVNADGSDVVYENELNFRNAEGDLEVSKKITRPSEDGKFYLVLKPTNIRDVFGNYNTETIIDGPYLFDSQAPNCPTITTSIAEKTWTNQDIEFKFQFTDDIAKYDWITYIDDTKESESTNVTTTTTKTLSASGERTIKLKIYDAAGNTRVCGNEKIYYIDKKEPTCKIKTTGTKGNGDWYKDNVTIKMTPEDTLSGVNEKSLTTNSDIKTYDGVTTGTQSTDTKGTLWYGYVKDNAGNTGICTETVMLDKTPPSCSIKTTPSATSSGWYSSDVSLKLNPTDATSSINQKGLTTSTKVTYNGTTTAKQESSTKEKTWYGYVEDKAGNTNSCQKTIKIDTTKASCTIEVTNKTEPIDDWYKEDVSLKMTMSSNVTEYGLTTSTTKTYNSKTTATQTANTTGTTWYGYIKTESGQEEDCQIMIKKDDVAPTCNITATGTKGKIDGKETGWFTSNVAIALNPKDTGGSGIAKNGLSYESLANAKTNGLTSNTQKLDKIRTWYGYVKDNAGNTTTCELEVKKDAEPPKCSISTKGDKKKSDSDWYTGDVTLTLTKSDNLSKVSTYGLSTSKGSTNKDDTKTQTSDTQKTTWYGNVVDKAGNTTSCSKNVYKDTVAPFVDDYATYDAGKCTSFKNNQRNTVIHRIKMIFEDSTSGITDVFYKYEYSDNTPDTDYVGTDSLGLLRSNTIVISRNIHGRYQRLRQDYNLTVKEDAWFKFKLVDRAGNSRITKSYKSNYDGAASSKNSGEYCRHVFPSTDFYKTTRANYLSKCGDGEVKCYIVKDA